MGYLIVYELEQFSIRQEMRTNIDLGVFDKRVSVITIDNELLASANHLFQLKGDEFTFKGKQYDILSKKTVGGKTTFYAMNDTKEEHLLSSLEDHIRNTTDLSQTNKQPLHAKNLCKNFSLLYYSEVRPYPITVPSTAVLYPSFQSIYQSIDKKAVLLPPKIA